MLLHFPAAEPMTDANMIDTTHCPHLLRDRGLRARLHRRGGGGAGRVLRVGRGDGGEGEGGDRARAAERGRSHHGLGASGGVMSVTTLFSARRYVCATRWMSAAVTAR